MGKIPGRYCTGGKGTPEGIFSERREEEDSWDGEDRSCKDGDRWREDRGLGRKWSMFHLSPITDDGRAARSDSYYWIFPVDIAKRINAKLQRE